MKKHPTVTIGIPAFNEQENIGFLLEDLLSQKEYHFTLEKIIVYSDASTDKTVKIIKKINSPLVEVIEGKDRMGVGHGSNMLMQNSNSDIFILLNADIVITDQLFVNKLISPIQNKNYDLVSGNLQPLPAESFFDNILFVSMTYKRMVFEGYKHGNNLFTCYGPMRAFSKRLYKKMTFKKSVADDMYSYFFCIYNNFKYAYAKEAIAYFKLPTNLSDYRKQSTRYWSSTQLFSEFGEKFIHTHYYLPKKIFFTKGFLVFLKHPLYAPLYPILPIITRLESLLKNEALINTWQIATSSKLANRASLQVNKTSYGLNSNEGTLPIRSRL